MNAALAFLAAGSFTLLSCVSNHCPYPPPGQTHVDRSAPAQSDKTMAVLWYQYAAEARALYYQAYNVAKDRLDAALAARRSKRSPAVIVDIDETILDNSPFEAFLIQRALPFAPELWSKWTGQSRSIGLPGAQTFLAYAASRGVDVFYLSNRSTNEFEATARNLKTLQFPMVDSDHLLLQQDGAGKEPNRLKVERKFEVVLLIGDNLGDFLAAFDKRNYADRFQLADSTREEFGRRFIVLPNPMYGGWESSIYSSSTLDESTKTELRRELLKSWKP